MRRMNHPGVLKLFEVHESDTNIYFVCEQLEGGELFQKLKNCPAGFSENYVVQVMHKLLSALSYIHS
jgi:calcium/calmodulin-dependent protein kinase I